MTYSSTILLLALPFAAAACASSSAGGSSSAADGGTCTPLSGTVSSDDAGHGCTASSGIYVNGSNHCASGDYGLTCDDSHTPPASSPCTVVPLPTPAGVTVYCCLCAH